MEEERKMERIMQSESICPHCKKKFVFQIPEGEEAPTQLTIGEIVIVSKKPLADCQTAVTSMLKDKTIKNYLRGFETKKIIRGASYID